MLLSDGSFCEEHHSLPEGAPQLLVIIPGITANPPYRSCLPWPILSTRNHRSYHFGYTVDSTVEDGVNDVLSTFAVIAVVLGPS